DAVPVQSRRPALAGLGRRVIDGALDASPRHAARGGAVWADQHGRPGLSRRRVPGGDHGADADGITRLPPAEQLVEHVLHGVHLRSGFCGLHDKRRWTTPTSARLRDANRAARCTTVTQAWCWPRSVCWWATAGLARRSPRTPCTLCGGAPSHSAVSPASGHGWSRSLAGRRAIGCGRRLRVVDDRVLADRPAPGPGPGDVALERATATD